MKARWLKKLIRICLVSLPLLTASAWVDAKVDPELRAYLKDAISSSSSFGDRFDAEVWLVDMNARMSRFIPDKEFRIEFLKSVHHAATDQNLPPEMVLALIHVESAFKPYALSHAGAQGYMQVMPFWRNEIGRPDDNLMEMQTNLKYGCAILAHYLKREKGNWIRALARYNGSLGKTWYPERVMNKWQRHWFVRQISFRR
ncbi:lytic transglycosylase domain-containing protein [Bermanella marisrubri]|uniref:Soluble lytic murein transglycosylase and related regulatory protein (Some contain LysM/invasin domains) n=1 Tax=Bermanella marisrubri TaxID=207949 RepID=Q1N6W9_9GAMM|nr:lytic transglycosylase domain-containing protein [Bermanella marisrubri]EAT13473.1 Soluble lytic murein transglycosylase and related regulatory protein (some contain LysM/invasin domains) [Oceanobacter sp. RED65] [Bermanella marisrubri]QIZ84276.1 lytic transglycosylase domain-containing protein [Bermanella marisrubri]